MNKKVMCLAPKYAKGEYEFQGFEIVLKQIVHSLRYLLLGILYNYTLGIPIHELGHYLIALFDGAKILGVHWYLWWDKGKLQDAVVSIDPNSFSTVTTHILYRSGGFLITFIPFMLLFVLWKRKKSDWWIFAFTVVALSFISSWYDFYQISYITQNSILAIIAQHFFPIITYVFLAVSFYFSLPRKKALKDS